MKIFLGFLFLFFCNFSYSQIGTGQWRLHVNASNAIDVCYGNNKVLAAFENGALEYDVNYHEKTEWNKINHLSEVLLSCVVFDSTSKAFWIGYQNGNMDKLDGSTVYNFPSLKLASIVGDKKILKFISHGNYLFAATRFGILKIDPIKMEVSDTYYPPLNGRKLNDFTFHNDSIYVVSDSMMFVINEHNSLIANPQNWKVDHRVTKRINAIYTIISSFNSRLILGSVNPLFGKDTLFVLEKSALVSLNNTLFSDEIELKAIQATKNELLITTYNNVFIYDNFLSKKEILYKYVFSNEPLPQKIVGSSTGYWVADRENGLVHWQDNYHNNPITMIGPAKRSFFSADCQQGKMAFSGGILHKSSIAFNGTGAYVFQDEKWSLLDRWNQKRWLNKNIWDLSSVAINPVNPSQIAFGSYSEIPLSIMNNNQQIDTTYDNSNSLLEKVTLGNGWHCVSDLKYDQNENLWMLNAYTNSPLKMLSKSGKWYKFETGGASKGVFTRKLIVDDQNYKWFTVYSTGIVGFSDGGTVDDPSDDVYRLINDGLTTGALPSKEVTALAMDFNNHLWIGTDNGFCILYNASSIFSADQTSFAAQRIKLRFEGNVEYLLGKTAISDIEVDGGNRKWIATANAGLFLLASDGSEILASYTTDNSPLISNAILDIKLNHQTGELFIITEEGLVSFRTDATQGDNTYANTLVFPNPLKPEHTTGITIQGIAYDSDIRITDAAGNLVYKTTSNGGTAHWDGKTKNGERATAGVYFIWTAPNEGDGNKVGKFVVIN
jgi:hypothetical protein